MHEYKHTIFSALAVAAMLAGTLHTSANAQVKRRVAPASKEPAACASLHYDYDMASKRVSLFSAEAAIMSGAESSRWRQKSADSIAEANATAALLRDNKCKPPVYAPTAARYFSQAMACWSAPQVGTALKPECNLENWKPE